MKTPHHQSALALITTLLLPATAAAADPPPGPGAPSSPYRIPQASSPVTVDGNLDDPAWAQAAVIPLRYETRPGENIQPPVTTDCLVIHDTDSLYVAFRAHDPEPAAIRAHLSDRDDAFNDDFVGIVLDPFNDERRGFEFFANPLGVQMDLFQDDVNGDEDESWDAIWDAAGRITDEGYVVEMAIPFHQLRFPQRDGEQTWGFDALRFYPRNQRHRISSHPLDRDVSCYLCQASKMVGFDGIDPGRNMEITPTLTATRVDEREDFPDGPLSDGEADVEPGITFRWGVTPSLTFNAAVNPDFSQVEADVAQLEVNEQFALFFPERRPFFLEGADFFSTPFDAVFTRNVADPAWGVKLSGKQGANGLGVFVAEDEITNLLIPGSQHSEAASRNFKSSDTVLRYRRDMGSSSALGVLVTDRSGDGYSNTLAGVDGLWRFSESNALRFQALGSETEYPGDLAAELGQPLGSFSDHAFQVRFDHDSRRWYAYGRYEDVGRDFRADMGFLPQVDYRFLLGGVERIWWGEEDDWYTQVRFGGDWDRREDQSGQLLEEEYELFFNMGGPRQSWVWLGPGMRRRTFNGVTFDERYINTWFEIQPTGDLFLSLSAEAGDDIDFANTRPGEVLTLEPTVRYNLGRHLRARLTHTFERLDVEGGRLFTANLSQLRLVYQLNLRTFVRGVFQYFDLERDPSLYQDEVEPELQRLLSELLFAYKLNPQTVLFLGYSDTRLGDAATSLTQSDRALFFKVGYAWVP